MPREGHLNFIMRPKKSYPATLDRRGSHPPPMDGEIQA